MTDKQIIIYKKECYNEPYCSLNQVLEQLKRKEQECERLRFPMQDTNYAILAKEEFEEYKKLKQTLEEIKEIASPYNDMSGNCVIVNCFEDMYKILQKISECEVNDE
jgi:transcriptional/translational regulatory protein YebC/TACO1